MSIDLAGALERIAADAGAAAQPVATNRVLSRMRRRRAARVTASSVAGVGAAGAVALAAVTLPRAGLPLTPATGSSDWPAVLADGEFACGSPAPVIVDPPGSEDLHFETGLVSHFRLTPGDEERRTWRFPGVTLAVGESLTVDVDLVNGTDRELVGSVNGKPQVRIRSHIVQSGKVVGSLSRAITFEARDPVELKLPEGGRSSENIGWTPAPCAPENWTDLPVDGEGETALPAGEYELYLSQTIFTPVEIDPVDGRMRMTPLITIAGGPYAFTIGSAASAS